jgi:hypothetical protein
MADGAYFYSNKGLFGPLTFCYKPQKFCINGRDENTYTAYTVYMLQWECLKR